MWYSGFKFFYISSLLYGLISFVIPLNTNGQGTAESHVIEAEFVHKTILLQQGSFGFNIVRIRNLSDTTLKLFPVFHLPIGWRQISSHNREVIINPYDSVSVPVRFNVPSDAQGGKESQIAFEGVVEQKAIVVNASFKVELATVRNWDISVPDRRVIVLPGNKGNKVHVKLHNEGNVAETIKLKIVPDTKLQIVQPSGPGLVTTIVLSPKADTILSFDVLFRDDKSNSRVFDIGKLRIEATNGITEIRRTALVEKYTDHYAPFLIDRNLLHTTEIGFRTFANNNEFLPFIKTRGTHVFDNEDTFKYNFTYFDLLEHENIISNSYYSFLYTKESLQLGLGAFSSSLGRNLYSRNSIMVSNKIKVGPESEIEGFTSYGFVDRKASVALGYGFNLAEVPMKVTASYNRDDQRKVNTTSLGYQADKIAIGKKHNISLRLYSYQEEHYENNHYLLRGLAYDVNYIGRITDKFDVQVFNSYGTPNMPGSKMGLFDLMLKSSYFWGENNINAFTLLAFNKERNYYTFNYEGFKSPNINLRNQFAYLAYKNAKSRNFRFDVGPSFEIYSASRPPTGNGMREIYAVEKYRLEFKAFVKQNLSFQIKGGRTVINHLSPQQFRDSDSDLHMNAELKMKGVGIRVNYDYGALSNYGLYQFVIDNVWNGLSVSPYLMLSFWDDRVRFNMFSNLVYRFDQNYGRISVNPNLECYLGRNWYAVANGNYNYTRQEYATNHFGRSYYYLEFALKKNWGRSKDEKWKNDLKDLRIQLFKDENGNGVKERTENGVSDVKVRIRLVNSDKQQDPKLLPVDITLVTNNAGLVHFSNIPKGFYEMEISPLGSMMEYFYIGQQVQRIEVFHGQMVQVPFQKANKLEGYISLDRQRFIKDSESNISLSNIKVTAYNNLGNSYSAFTDSEGRFKIFVPGTHVYYLRINNIFGSAFTVIDNDISVQTPVSDGHRIVFKVIEHQRRINFKRVSTPEPDSAEYRIQRIRMLSGHFAQPESEVAVEDETKADLHQPEQKTAIVEMYYVVLAESKQMRDAMRHREKYTGQGINTAFVYDQIKKVYYVYSQSFTSREEAQISLRDLEKKGVRNMKIVRYP